ncbi:hypothetical protein GGF31_000488 [Allomyces arbusculus]|nr:hypothetical protein GGF31_000488 [Allomyces arbusculus]
MLEKYVLMAIDQCDVDVLHKLLPLPKYLRSDDEYRHDPFVLRFSVRNLFKRITLAPCGPACDAVVCLLIEHVQVSSMSWKLLLSVGFLSTLRKTRAETLGNPTPLARMQHHAVPGPSL